MMDRNTWHRGAGEYDAYRFSKEFGEGQNVRECSSGAPFAQALFERHFKAFDSFASEEQHEP